MSTCRLFISSDYHLGWKNPAVELFFASYFCLSPPAFFFFCGCNDKDSNSNYHDTNKYKLTKAGFHPLTHTHFIHSVLERQQHLQPQEPQYLLQRLQRFTGIESDYYLRYSQPRSYITREAATALPFHLRVWPPFFFVSLSLCLLLAGDNAVMLSWKRKSAFFSLSAWLWSLVTTFIPTRGVLCHSFCSLFLLSVVYRKHSHIFATICVVFSKKLAFFFPPLNL